MNWLTAAGLGLDYDSLRLEPTSEAWVAAGVRLRDGIAEVLVGQAAAVEHVGSSAVVGLHAKPVVDVAVGLAAEHDVLSVESSLVGAGWIYRGDSGDSGGRVFVLEARPWHRVAHIHVVDYDGEQWNNYLLFRDLLRRDPSARERYQAVKQQLASQVGDDRVAYTDGKTAIVRLLLDEAVAGC